MPQTPRDAELILHPLSEHDAIGLVADDFVLGPWLGLLGFVGVIVWLYRWMLRRSEVAR